MLSSAEIIRTVVKLLKPQQIRHLVVDPVMIAKGRAGAVETRRHRYHQRSSSRWLCSSHRTCMKRSSCRYRDYLVGRCPACRQSHSSIRLRQCAHQRGHLPKDRGTDLSMTDGSSTSSKGNLSTPRIRTAPAAPLHPPSPHTSPGENCPDAIQTAKPISPKPSGIAWRSDMAKDRPIISIFEPGITGL